MRAAPRLLLASAVVVAVYVGLSALVTVAFEPWVAGGLLIPDSESLWRLRPGFTGSPGGSSEALLVAVRIDARGFRHIGGAAATSGRRETILTVGDSFTFGWDVADADTYPAQLQELLDQRAAGRFEVINGGMPGCTSFQARQLLQGWLPQLEPSVLVTLLGRNDGRVAPLSDSAAQRILGWKPEALDYVFPFMLLHYRSVSWLAQAVGAPGGQRVPAEDFIDNMEAIAELAHANGVRSIVMQHWTGSPAFQLARFADARDLGYIDTPGLLSAASAGGGPELFIRAHYHPNRTGYAVIAAALADEILDGR